LSKNDTKTTNNQQTNGQQSNGQQQTNGQQSNGQQQTSGSKVLKIGDYFKRLSDARK